MAFQRKYQPPFLTLYVDEFAIWLTGSSPEVVRVTLQNKINAIAEYVSSRSFTISTRKTVIYYTKLKTTPNMAVRVTASPITFDDHVKFLGLTFDQRITWRFYIEAFPRKCIPIPSLLEKLSHLRWEADRKTLLNLHCHS